MPHRYLYPNSEVLRNRFEVHDAAVLNDLEAIWSERGRQASIEGFTPDLDGLRKVHERLLGSVYEWAGKTRADEVTIDGETFTPEDHIVSKGSTQFAPASVSTRELVRALQKSRSMQDKQHGEGQLDFLSWSKVTADHVGAINHAHPFREGNGRAMRRYVELSAQVYGYRVRVHGGPEWVRLSHDAMDHKMTAGLAKYLGESRVSDQEVSEPAANYDVVAKQAISKMRDPDKRRSAQMLLTKMQRLEKQQSAERGDGYER